MAIIDTRNLPLPILAAITQDDHISQGSHLGAATVGMPVQQVALRRKHAAEIVEEASDQIWALFGSAVHVVLFQAGKDQSSERRKIDDAILLIESLQEPGRRYEEGSPLVDTLHYLYELRTQYDSEPQPFQTFREQRWEITVLGWRVAARCDHLTLEDDGMLTDYKVTSVWSVKDGTAKDEWIAQLNVTRYCAKRAAGLDPKRLQVTAFLRDWRKNERLSYGEEYPPYQVATVPVPLWSDDQTLAYLEERVALHQQAQIAVENIGKRPSSGMELSMAFTSIPECTPAERWAKPETFAVVKKGNKRATRVYPDRATADAHVKSQAGYEVQVRPEQSPRCLQYCNVLPFCSQGQRISAALNNSLRA